jgi:hypothetical protein
VDSISSNMIKHLGISTTYWEYKGRITQLRTKASLYDYSKFYYNVLDIPPLRLYFQEFMESGWNNYV